MKDTNQEYIREVMNIDSDNEQFIRFRRKFYNWRNDFTNLYFIYRYTYKGYYILNNDIIYDDERFGKRVGHISINY